MSSGQRSDGWAQGISSRVRRAIMEIKEIVGSHSDAEIYAALKESNMDPNETAQKLLNQDPFHVVRRKRERKKENVSNVGFSEFRAHTDLNTRAEKLSSWDQNARRMGHSRNPTPGIGREFRVVRDNRVNRTSSREHNDDGRNAKFCLFENSNHGANLMEANVSVNRSSDGHSLSQGLYRNSDSGSGYAEVVESDGGQKPRFFVEANTTISNSAASSLREVPLISSRPASSSSVIGVYSSSLDPVHVPSPDSRSTGSIGAIGREIGVVGVRRQCSDFSMSQQPVSNSSSSVSQSGRLVCSSKESFRQSAASRNNQPSQTSVLEPLIPSISSSKSLQTNLHNARVQQLVSRHKVTHSTMEWKPKLSKIIGDGSSCATGKSSLPSSLPNGSADSPTREVTALSEMLSQTDLFDDNKHVIIPEHLRVPESERTLFIFGSFGVGLDSAAAPTTQGYRNIEELHNEPDLSPCASELADSGEGYTAEGQGDLVDPVEKISRSNSPESAAASEKLLSGNEEILSHNIDAYGDIGLVEGSSQTYSSSEPLQLQFPPCTHDVSETYNPQSSYDGPFFRTTIDDGMPGPLFISNHEALAVHISNNSPRSVTMPLQQQQQPVAQMYPQVHISHLPNFVPFRHVFSPIYGPSVVPNYPSSPAYPQPSSASNYFVMPGGAKYAPPSQYKPVPASALAGYGGFANPSGYAVAAPPVAFGNPVAQDDAARIKYKDGNLYGPNPQAEVSPDLWVQTARELQGLQQSSPYFNLAAQVSTHAAFLPAHAGVGQGPSHMQYPGLFHAPQLGSMTAPHSLVHQQVPPSMGGSIGVAAPRPQVGGAYQQPYQQPPQMGSHLNWTPNF